MSGVYAVVGSAAMLCGFKQMTLAAVMIVVECINDLRLALVTIYNNILVYYSILYSALLYSTLLYSTLLYSTLLYSTTIM